MFFYEFKFFCFVFFIILLFIFFMLFSLQYCMGIANNIQCFCVSTGFIHTQTIYGHFGSPVTYRSKCIVHHIILRIARPVNVG